MNEYSEEQQATMRFIREHDKDFEDKMISHKISEFSTEMLVQTRLREGSEVVLCDLENEQWKHWNGKKAKITGDKVIEKGVIRWPVLLMDGSEEEALFKQMNLQKVNLQKVNVEIK